MTFSGLPRTIATHLDGPTVNWEFVQTTLRRIQDAIDSSGGITLTLDQQGRDLLNRILEKDPPSDVVAHLLRAFPRACYQNASVFDIAIQHNNVDVIRLLSRSYFSFRRLPTCPYSGIVRDGISAQIAEIIINEYPQGVIQRVHDYPCSLLDRELTRVLPDDDLSKWLEKLLLMVKAAERITLHGAQRGSYPIHFLMDYIVRSRHFQGKPFSMSQRMQDAIDRRANRFALMLHQISLKYPDLFCCLDENGDAPLHILLRGPVLGGGYYESLPSSISNVLNTLVDLYGASATQRCRNGRLPIHVGLENGWPCHNVLIREAPHCVSVRDPVSGLYPFQIAAASSSVERPQSQVDPLVKGARDTSVIYELLRQDPLLVRGTEGTPLS